jgi:hypothetical protein
MLTQGEQQGMNKPNGEYLRNDYGCQRMGKRIRNKVPLPG